MSENSIKSIMDVTMDKLRAMVDANTIIGDPIVVRRRYAYTRIKGFVRACNRRERFSKQNPVGPFRRRRRRGRYGIARSFYGGKRRKPLK